MTDDEIKGIWKVLDVDRHGKVSKGEFLRFFREHSEGNGEASEALTRKIKTGPRSPGSKNELTKHDPAKLKTMERAWVQQFAPSPSGVLRQEDALRNYFRTEG